MEVVIFCNILEKPSRFEKIDGARFVIAEFLEFDKYWFRRGKDIRNTPQLARPIPLLSLKDWHRPDRQSM